MLIAYPTRVWYEAVIFNSKYLKLCHTVEQPVEQHALVSLRHVAVIIQNYEGLGLRASGKSSKRYENNLSIDRYSYCEPRGNRMGQVIHNVVWGR